MKKPNEFKEWCQAHHIQPRSHDESVAWVAWQACYAWLIKAFKEANNAKK